jgi:8-oxo-dGDP phosphatase
MLATSGRCPDRLTVLPGPATVHRMASLEAEASLPVGPWIRRSRAVVYENAWITVWHDEVVRPDGSEGVYGVVHFPREAVGVVAVDEEGRILMVGQHRYTLDEYSWELPEGGVDPGESLLEGAQRELREETGFEAVQWRELARITLSNSVTDERGAIFLATGLQAGQAAPEATEDLALRWMHLDEVLAAIDAGEIRDVITVAGIGRYALGRSLARDG